MSDTSKLVVTVGTTGPINRFRIFTDVELETLWDGLAKYDGRYYGIEEDDQPTYTLASELYAEAQRRGMAARDAYRWENAL